MPVPAFSLLEQEGADGFRGPDIQTAHRINGDHQMGRGGDFPGQEQLLQIAAGHQFHRGV